MKKKIIVLMLILLGAGIFASVLANANWDEILAKLGKLTLGKFLIFMAIAQISYALMNWRWQKILKTHGHHVSFFKLWIYRASGYGVAYITPTQLGGEPVRIYFLNENHGINLRESTASVLLDKLLEIASFLVFVASGVIVVSFTNLLPDKSLYLIIALVGSFVILTAYVFKKLYDGTGFLTHLFQKFGLHRIKDLQNFEQKIYNTEKLIMDFLCHGEHKKTTLPVLSAISLLAWAFTIFEYYILAGFMGVFLTGYESFLVATVPSMAYLIPIPGGLGMLEGAQVGLFTVLGYSASLALAVVVMVRIKEMFFSSIGFAYMLTHGLTLLGKENTKKTMGKSTLSEPRKITDIVDKPAIKITQPSGIISKQSIRQIQSDK